MSFSVINTDQPKNPFFDSATIDEINATSINVTTLTATNIITSDPVSGSRIQTVLAYAPTEFATMAENTAYTLMNAPNLSAAANINDSGILKIPANATLREMIINDNGTAITPSGGFYRIRYDDTTINSTTAGGALVFNQTGGSLSGYGKFWGGTGDGAFFTTASTTDVKWFDIGGAATDPDFFLTVTRNTDAQGTNTAGDLIIELTYSVPESS